MKNKASTALQFMECTITMLHDSIDQGLHCVCQRYSTNDEVDYSLEQQNGCAGRTSILQECFSIELQPG